MKKHILKFTALLSFIFFFFPFCTVSCERMEIAKLNGWNLTKGAESYGTHFGYPFVILLLLLPLLVLFVSYYKKEKERLAALTSSGVGIFILGILAGVAKSNEHKYGVEISAGAGYYLYLLSCLFSGGYILYEVFMLKNGGVLVTPLEEGHVDRQLPPLTEETFNQWKKKAGETLGEVAVKLQNSAETVKNDLRKAAQTKPCGGCGAQVEFDAQYCTQCGAKL